MLSEKRKIVVLSPHLDDAVLSCAAHIRHWKKAGHDVHVITVFTKFLSPITQFAKDYIKKSGFKNAGEFEKARKQEDRKAMKLLGVTYEHWDFIDAGFRRNSRNQALYSHNQLFSGNVPTSDELLNLQIQNKLSEQKAMDKIVVPQGIGKHLDHVLVRKVAEQVFPKSNLMYFIDFPYALKFHNWTFRLFLQMLKKRKSILRFLSKDKLALIKCYASQTKLLFDKLPSYPEILLS